MAVAAVVVIAVGAAACGETKTGDATAFCTQLEANAPAIMNPQITTSADVDSHLGLYESLAEEVPLAIEEEWDTLVRAYRSAAAVIPGDAESVEIARREAYASEPSGLAVRDWVTANCAFDLAAVGPIGSLAPATTTTTAPSND